MPEIPSCLQKSIFRFIPLLPRTKIPIEENWPNKNYEWQDVKFQEFLSSGCNYGVLGGPGDLVIIDADVEEVRQAVIQNLPPTLEIESGSGKTHFYFFCPDLARPIRLALEGGKKGKAGDVQGKGKQVVGPGSIHPNGQPYKIRAEREITMISSAALHFALREFIDEPSLVFEVRGRPAEIANLRIEDVVPLQNLTPHGAELFGPHPLHGSDGGKNFWVNPAKGLWHCFRCESGGDALTWLAVQEGIITCQQAVPGGLRGDAFYQAVKKAQELALIEISKKTAARALIPGAPARETVSRDPLFTWPVEETNFLTAYANCMGFFTDAYPEYHVGVGFFLLGAAANRQVSIEITPRKIFTNIWVILLGASTVSRKSTSIDLGRDVLMGAGPGCNLIPDDFSPESFVESFAKGPQAAFFRDEFGGFLAAAKRQYMAGVNEMMARFYDCPDAYARNLRKQQFEITNAYLSLCAGMVPEELGLYVQMSDIYSGFIPRMLVLFPEREKNSRPMSDVPAGAADAQAACIVHLWKIANFTKYCAEARQRFLFRPSAESLSVFNAWKEKKEKALFASEEKDMGAFLGRYSTYAWKLAALIEIGSEAFQEKIELARSQPADKSKFSAPLPGERMAQAVELLDTLFLPYAQKLVSYVRSHEKGNDVRKIFDLVRRYGQPFMNRRKLLQYSNLRVRDFEECVQALVESGQLLVAKDDKGGLIYSVAEKEAGGI